MYKKGVSESGEYTPVKLTSHTCWVWSLLINLKNHLIYGIILIELHINPID